MKIEDKFVLSLELAEKNIQSTLAKLRAGAINYDQEAFIIACSFDDVLSCLEDLTQDITT